MSEPRTRRTSDRLLTPAVVVTALVIGGGCVALVIASVTFLTARGQDPDPMLRLVAEVTGAVGVLINLMLTIGGRAGVAKVERLTGRDIPVRLDQIEAKVEESLWVEDQPTQALPPVPPRVTQPHPLNGP